MELLSKLPIWKLLERPKSLLLVECAAGTSLVPSAPSLSVCSYISDCPSNLEVSFPDVYLESILYRLFSLIAPISHVFSSNRLIFTMLSSAALAAIVSPETPPWCSVELWILRNTRCGFV